LNYINFTIDLHPGVQNSNLVSIFCLHPEKTLPSFTIPDQCFMGFLNKGILWNKGTWGERFRMKRKMDNIEHPSPPSAQSIAGGAGKYSNGCTDKKGPACEGGALWNY
jgi:hypothetical protein